MLREAGQPVQRAGDIRPRGPRFVIDAEAEPGPVERGDRLSAVDHPARTGTIPGGTMLIARPPDGPVNVPADRLPMQLVRLNLIRNAAGAIADRSPPAGRPGCLVLAARLDGAGGGQPAAVRISVADNGPGLPRAVRPRLVTPFVSARGDGTGVGLAIRHSIVEVHRARVAVETGKCGTIFRIALPLAGRPEDRDEPSRA